MLKELYIKNLGVFSEASIDFSSGLNVITGESGAGKSVLLQAIDLAVGQRLSSQLLRSSEKQATIVLQVLPPFSDQLTEKLGVLGVEWTVDEGLYFRRVINENSQSKAYLNDVPMSLKKISEIAALLLHKTNQHEAVRLKSAQTPSFFLDTYIAKKDVSYSSHLQKLTQLYDAYQELKSQVAQEREALNEAKKQEDYLRFVYAEFEKVDLKVDEEKKLQDRKFLLKNSAKVFEISEKLSGKLDPNASWSSDLNQIEKDLLKLTELSDSYEPYYSDLQNFQASMQQLSIDLNDQIADLSSASVELFSIEERLSQINELKTKHQKDFHGLLEYLEALHVQIQSLDSLPSLKKNLEEKVKVKHDELLVLAELISQTRKRYAPELSTQIIVELESLGFKKAQIEFKSIIKAVTREGIDQVDMFLSLNPGQELRPLSEAASGGELSRLLLALRGLLYDESWQGSLIFDEVDQGLSGLSADLVGERLSLMSQDYQVLCVSHLAQVTAYAQKHIQVQKKADQNETHSEILTLSHEDRIRELARLVAGRKVTAQTLEHAKQLLEHDLREAC